MATAREYFEKSSFLQFGQIITLAAGDGASYEVRAEVVQDFDGGSKYLKLYIPEARAPESILAHVLDNAHDLIWKAESEFLVTAGMAGTSEKVSNRDLRFSGRVLVYTPSVTTPEQWASLSQSMSAKGLSLLVRDGGYTAMRAQFETPLAFISHDSRDKEPFVRELANTLANMLCPVWYDEFKLQPGDSLRESIEKGLKVCQKSIVVLSKNFFSNPGWTKREFDMIYTREVFEGRRLMIPIWLDVERMDVYNYCPVLLDTLGIHSSIGVDAVARKIVSVLNYNPPHQ